MITSKRDITGKIVFWIPEKKTQTQKWPYDNTYFQLSKVFEMQPVVFL